MALQFVRTNAPALAAELRALVPRLRDTAIVRSLNYAARGTRVEARRMVQAELALKAGDITKELSVKRASRALPEAVLEVRSRPVGLVKYGARQTSRGVTVKVKRRGARKLVRSAFIANVRSGHRAVWVRQRLGGGRRAGRLPIEELFSTSIIQYLDDRLVIARLERKAGELFDREFKRQLRVLLAKQREAA
jgi:hypothetical protein